MIDDHRLPYADHDSTHQMHDDCSACASSIPLATDSADAAAHTMPTPAPELDHTHESHAADIEVPDATADLASRMHLHFH